MSNKSPFLEVTAKQRDGKGENLVFVDVYDIGHFYSRNTGEEDQHLRLLIGEPFGRTERKYIDLFKYDVIIHLDT